MKNSDVLAEQHGVKTSTFGYLSYYVPCLIWMRQYRWSWLKGDVTSAVTLASMYLPMALSYAENLAHVPAINGLYAFVFMPIIYALLGSCPQMVVGPEAAGSLLVGTIVKQSIDLGEDDNEALQAEIAGVAVGMAGATVFIMGLLRLGFVDSVLSRPFLRGFISAIGLVIFIDQLIPALGLHNVAKVTPGVTHGSTVDKLTFVVTNLASAHKLSAIIGAISFVVVMALRYVLVDTRCTKVMANLNAEKSSDGSNRATHLSRISQIDSSSLLSLYSSPGSWNGIKKVSRSLERSRQHLAVFLHSEILFNPAT